MAAGLATLFVLLAGAEDQGSYHPTLEDRCIMLQFALIQCRMLQFALESMQNVAICIQINAECYNLH